MNNKTKGLHYLKASSPRVINYHKNGPHYLILVMKMSHYSIFLKTVLTILYFFYCNLLPLTATYCAYRHWWFTPQVFEILAESILIQETLLIHNISFRYNCH